MSCGKLQSDIGLKFQEHLLVERCQSLAQYQASIDATGSPLTNEALNAAKKPDAVLLGAIGGAVSLCYVLGIISFVSRILSDMVLDLSDQNKASSPSANCSPALATCIPAILLPTIWSRFFSLRESAKASASP